MLATTPRESFPEHSLTIEKYELAVRIALLLGFRSRLVDFSKVNILLLFRATTLTFNRVDK